MMKGGGIQASLRQKLSELLCSSQDIITIKSAAKIWSLKIDEARDLLLHLANNGWLSRIKRGHYISVPLSSINTEPPLEFPWSVATCLFEPCYIAGWSAAEYWDLTEQIFNKTLVLTTKQQRQQEYLINATTFLVHTVQAEAFYGTNFVWQGQTRVGVSDPSKTIVDMFYRPAFGGGIRQVTEFYKNYLRSKHKNVELLLQYALQLDKGVVFKRLGFITEKFFPEEKLIISVSRKSISSGYSLLDTNLPKQKLVRRWNLWVSNSWLKEIDI